MLLPHNSARSSGSKLGLWAGACPFDWPGALSQGSERGAAGAEDSVVPLGVDSGGASGRFLRWGGQ
eukprot:scaffold4722_cov417-Prasinococcus_capsulatus_cf.AAC.5